MTASYRAVPNPYFNSLFPWAVYESNTLDGEHAVMFVHKQATAEQIATVLNADEQ